MNQKYEEKGHTWCMTDKGSWALNFCVFLTLPLGCQGLDLSVKTLWSVVNKKNNKNNKPNSNWLKERKGGNVLVLIIEKSGGMAWLQEWLDPEFSCFHQDVISLLSIVVSFQASMVSFGSFRPSFMESKWLPWLHPLHLGVKQNGKEGEPFPRHSNKMPRIVSDWVAWASHSGWGDWLGAVQILGAESNSEI